MLGLDPVGDTDVVATFSEMVTEIGAERTGATLRHYATVKKSVDTGRLISEVRAEKPTEIPWVLVSCQPAGQDHPPVDVAGTVEQLQLWFTKSIASVGGTRWTEDGVTVVYNPGHVTDATIFSHDLAVDGFTRSPLLRRRPDDGFDLMGKRLEARVMQTALMARDWYISMDLDATIYIDISLVSVQGARFQLGRNPMRRLGGFTRDYVHLTNEWVYASDDSKLGLEQLCDRLWQAGGVSGSQLEGSGDPRG